MDENAIKEIGDEYLGATPIEISRKTIGMCNEVYELKYDSTSFILRMNEEKEWIYGTHRFLPLFQELNITTPAVVHEDYSKTKFPFCFQILTKIEGNDLGQVIHHLTASNLKNIAKEISNVFNKFNELASVDSFGLVSGLAEEKYASLAIVIENQRKTIIERNKTSNVIDKELIQIYDGLISRYKNYFTKQIPKLYYDDISSKNVMIHKGAFSGIVDLDYLSKGDYLEAIGRIKASWHGMAVGKIYCDEIIRLQNLNQTQQNIIKVYAIFNLISWISEEGIIFNGNSTGVINWSNVNDKREKVIDLYNLLED